MMTPRDVRRLGFERSDVQRRSSGCSQNNMSAANSTEASPSPSPINTNNAPKYGTLVPNRIFVGGISANTTESELHALFSTYGNVKATKIISDRAGVSKGYGFVTFETEEEAKRIQKEADNIVLKDRKLNIAPAIKKQQPFTRMFDPTQVIPNGTVMYHNGVPYTYQNGMAFFTSPESSYSFPQPQAAYPMIYPQPVYLPQQQYQYQTPTAQPQWTAGNQWRWAPPITFGQGSGSPYTTVAGSDTLPYYPPGGASPFNPNLPATQYIYPPNAATAASPALSVPHAASDAFPYAQPAAHAPYQPPATDLADISILEATPAEDAISLMEPQRQPNKSMNRQQVSSAIDFHVLPLDQGNKSFKKPGGGSPRKAYNPSGAGRLQQHQHRQKFMAKHVNGLHILAYPSEKPEDMMHISEAGMAPAGGPLTPPSTPMTSVAQDVSNPSIIESTRKLQALSL